MGPPLHTPRTERQNGASTAFGHWSCESLSAPPGIAGTQIYSLYCIYTHILNLYLYQYIIYTWISILRPCNIRHLMHALWRTCCVCLEIAIVNCGGSTEMTRLGPRMMMAWGDDSSLLVRRSGEWYDTAYDTAYGRDTVRIVPYLARTGRSTPPLIHSYVSRFLPSISFVHFISFDFIWL